TPHLPAHEPREVQESSQLELVVGRDLGAQVRSNADPPEQCVPAYGSSLRNGERDLVVVGVGSEALARHEDLQLRIRSLGREEDAIELIERRRELRSSHVVPADLE